MHLWLQLQLPVFWRHKLCTDGFCDIPNFSAEPLKSCYLGWGLLIDSHFQATSKMLVPVKALVGTLKDIQSCLEDASALLYLWSAWTFSTVWGPWRSRSSIHQIHHYSLTHLPMQATWKHPRCLYLCSFLLYVNKTVYISGGCWN